MHQASPAAAIRRRYRSVFLSDLHLGTRDCRAELLADFLRHTACARLYLVGDIIDGWQLRRRAWHWDVDHDEAVRLVLRMARAGTAVTYIPGNHDEMLRPWLPLGLELGRVRLRAEAVHRAADGRRFLVTHGDAFDGVVRCGGLLAPLGDRAYDCALALNRWFNAGRRRLGHPYWSLSRWLKRQVGEALAAIARFEAALAHEARRRGFHGVVCGHIHHPEMREIGGVLYMNAGDWVESCTALVEHEDGRFALLDWAREHHLAWLTAAAPGGTELAAIAAEGCGATQAAIAASGRDPAEDSEPRIGAPCDPPIAAMPGQGVAQAAPLPATPGAAAPHHPVPAEPPR